MMRVSGIAQRVNLMERGSLGMADWFDTGSSLVVINFSSSCIGG